MVKKSLIVFISLLLIGCNPVKDTRIKHPDADMVFIEAKGRARVALWKDGKLVEYGWIDLDRYDGWTLTKYDWSENE